MKIKRWYRFINEDLKSDIEGSLKDSKDLKSAIVEKIIKSLNTDERKVFDEFIEAFVKDDKKKPNRRIDK